MTLSTQLRILQSLERENEDLTRQKNEQEEISRQRVEEEQTLDAVIVALKEQLNETKRVCEEVKGEVKNVDESLSKKRHEISDLDAKQSELNETFEEQTLAIEAKRKVLDALQNEILSQKNCFSEAENQLAERSSYADQLNQDIRSARNVQANERKEFEKSKRIFQNKQQLCDIKKASIPSLKARVDEAKITLTSYKKTIISTLSDEKELNECRKSVMNEVLKSSSIGENKKATLYELNDALHQKEAELRTWAKEEQKVGSLCSQMKFQVESLQRTAEFTEARKKQLFEQQRIKEATIAELERRFKNLMSRLKAMETETQNCETDCNRLDCEISARKVEAEELRNNLIPRQNELEALQKRSLLLKALLAKEAETFHGCKAHQSHLRVGLQNAGANLKKRQFEARLVGLELERYQREKTKVLSEVSNLEKKLSDFDSDYSFKIGLLAERQDMSHCQQQRIKDLKQSLIRAREERKELETKNKRLKEKGADVDRMCASLEKRASEMPIEAEKVKNLKLELLEQQKKRKELEEEIQIPNFKEINERRSSDDDAVESVDVLKAKVLVLEDQIETCRREINAKEVELEDICSKNERSRIQGDAEERESSLQRAMDYQAVKRKINKTSRELRAATGEQTMQQKRETELNEQFTMLQKELAAVQGRIRDGKPPSKDARAQL